MVEDIKILRGRFIGAMRQKNHVASEMNWIDVFEEEASCTCCMTAQTYIYSRLRPKADQDICRGAAAKSLG